MTNNIVAEFSCSVWKKSEEERASSLGFNVGDFKVYPVINGSTFNEEYNETLDSAAILLSQVQKEDRLSNIKPYDYVRVYDTSSAFDPDTGRYDFDKIFLVDNFNEQENNIKEHIFGYTINLMSETKWLEKIQCPNLAITHKVNEDGTTTKKTIYEHIKQYMELFVPRIKMFNGSGWSYEPLIKCPSQYEEDGVTETAFYKKFKITCADLAFTAPTLRQLLTNIMLQVGCIPVVHNRTLGFLDFQAQTHEFGGEHGYDVDNTVNFIKRSLSSDSFANTLVNISENVLDSGNEVICETLGFRDKENVILKQQENLFLETSFPIYKINKCLLRIPGKYTGFLSSSRGCVEYDGASAWASFPEFFYTYNTIINNVATVKIFVETDGGSFSPESSYFNVSIKDNLIYFLGRRSNGSYYIISKSSFSNFVLDSSNTIDEEITLDGALIETKTRTFTFNSPSNAIGFCFSGTFTNDRNETKTFSFIKFDNNDANVKYFGWSASQTTVDLQNAVVAAYDISFAGNRCWDISKLVVENSVRNLLDNNFSRMINEMPDNDTSKWTIETLSKYIYGTIGYSIGSKKIEGFSEIFNIGSATWLGWIRKGYTYIENIINFMKYNFNKNETQDLLFAFFEFLLYIPVSFGTYDQGDYFTGELGKNLFVDLDFSYYVPTTNNFSGTPFFSTCIFDIYYQPLNSFNLAYSKKIEDIDIPITQYDGNASGLSDFDRLSLHEQEQVDRIGNETLSINQRTNDYRKIQNFKNGPLVFMDDTNRSGSIGPEDKGVKYVIFKRSFTINNNCYNASYVGSKDAVLKDYFTSIRTKYRAYQYVDYNSSVLRKERDTFFVRVSSNYYNGDDRIWLGNYNTKKPENISYWIYDTTNSSSQQNSISYECEYALGLVNVSLNGISTQEEQSQRVKNSVSLIATQNMIGIIYECIDNIGTGPYLSNITRDDNIGGITQTWQVWADSYRTSRTVSFVNYINFYNQMITVTGNADVIKNQISKIEKSPLIDVSYIDLYGSDNVIFNVVDDNTKATGSYTRVQRTFYKDLAERINHTVQFIYYAPDNDVLFGEDFVAGAPLVSRYEHSFNSIFGSSVFEINTNKHDKPDEDIEIIGSSNGTIFLNSANEISVKLVDSSASSTAFWIYEHVFEYNYSNLNDYERILFDVNNATINARVPYSYVSIRDIKSRHVIRCAIRTTYSNIGFFTFTIPYTYNNSIFNTVDSNSIPVLRVYWNNYEVIKICDKNSNDEVIDIAVFKRPEGEPEYTDYYFTINDTKTDYVLAEKNGILYRRYVVSKNTLSRTVENSPDIYDEEE